MTYLTKEALPVLVRSLATCGGDVGPLYSVAKTLAKRKEGELTELIPAPHNPVIAQAIARLSAESKGGEITPASILGRFGHPRHFQEMNKESLAKLPSVAGEIPADIRAVLHTMLPVDKKGVYVNEGRIITLKGLVPLGPQTGNLVAHLAGVFSSGCTDAEIAALLAAQAADVELMAQADRVGTFDYTGTKLREVTARTQITLRI